MQENCCLLKLTYVVTAGKYSANHLDEPNACWNCVHRKLVLDVLIGAISSKCYMLLGRLDHHIIRLSAHTLSL